jgi:hypothetical protein
VKLIHLLVVVVFLGISTSVALADGVPTDPVLVTKGCGGKGQVACDAEILTAGGTVNFTGLSFLTADQGFNTDTNQCNEGTVLGTSCNPFNTTAALGVVLNDTGDTLTMLNVTASGSDSSGNSLLFGPCTGGEIFPTCTEIGTNSGIYALSGGSLCSVESADIIGGALVPDGDADDACGVIIGFVPGSATENLQGATMSFSANVPEPSSALLLLFGLAAGLFALKGLRPNLA